MLQEADADHSTEQHDAEKAEACERRRQHSLVIPARKMDGQEQHGIEQDCFPVCGALCRRVQDPAAEDCLLRDADGEQIHR